VFKNKFSQIERDEIVSLASETIFESSDDAEVARRYLLDERDISEQTIRRFQIGYVPMRAKHSLSGRIILPITDMVGRNVALTTRLIVDKSYLGKHWHESFSKKKYIYGIQENLDQIILKRKVILVEGQFDALRLCDSGMPIAVATLGSSVSIYQLCKLIQLADDIFLCFDNDDAGKKAVSQVFSLLKKYQLWRQKDINIITVPIRGVKDPDEYISRYGKKDFIKRLKESKQRYEAKYRKNESGSVFDFEIV